MVVWRPLFAVSCGMTGEMATSRPRSARGVSPGRCLLGFLFPFVAGCYCGSSQSLWAMVLSQICGWGPFLLVFSGDCVSWRKAASPVDTKALKDFLVIFFFCRGPFCSLDGAAFFPVSFAYAFVCVRVLVCFPRIVIYAAYALKKKKRKGTRRCN
jgi:hypothetical protein